MTMRDPIHRPRRTPRPSATGRTDPSSGDERFRLLVENIPIAAALLDRDMRYIVVSERWLRDYELGERDLKGLSHYDVFPQIPEHWKAGHGRALAGETVTAEDDSFVTAEGDVRWLRWNVQPWRDSAGEIGGIIIFSEDVSAQKRLDEALQLERNKLQAVIDKLDVGIFLMSPDGATVSPLNRAAVKMRGVPPSRHGEDRLADFDDQFELFDLNERPLSPGQRPGALALRGVYVRKFDMIAGRRGAGQRHFLRVSAAPIRDAEGKVALVAFSLTDLTDLKEAQQSLVAAAARHRAIVETTLDGVLVTDERGVIQSANLTSERMFGYDAGELVGQHVSLLTPLEDAAAHGDYLRDHPRAAVRRIIGTVRELAGRRKDGTLFPLELAIGSWTDDSGHRFYAGLVRDISDRKQAQEALVKAQQLEAIGRLAGGVAHDSNNLLTVIGANLELAEARTEDPETRRLLGRAIQAVADNRSFNQRILSLSHTRTVPKRRVWPNRQVQEIVELLNAANHKHIRLETDLASDAWPTLCDPGEINGALLNLEFNARDAMPGGGVLTFSTRNVTLGRRAARMFGDQRPGDYVRLSVSDTGEGMPPEVLRRATEPFFTTKKAGIGTGLGLASVQAVVRKAGGFLAIDSQPGSGASVSLFLPRAPQDEAGSDADGRMPLGDGETVLVVEDNDNVREATLQLIKQLGYDAIEARSADEAQRIVESGLHVDLVFSDIIMPARSGRDLARWLRSRRPDVKVLLTSANGHAAGDPTTEETEPLLAKPFNRAELARAIRSVLG